MLYHQRQRTIRAHLVGLAEDPCLVYQAGTYAQEGVGKVAEDLVAYSVGLAATS